ncbi:uncharacterized protein LOC141695631 [Apium graveolens]|uniref:uncharacterized protein LOC141695631 n=1 Tax=Apium graveolens TaxID=4045 RepID=UPI003D79C0A2
MKSQRRVKDMQSLTGRVAALNRFVSRSSDKCQKFFKAIKSVGKNLEWTEECEDAFLNIKKHLGNLPMLSNPKAGEVLILYLVVSDFSVSDVLFREEGDVQLPVYYVSKRLSDAETRHASLEKLTYAIILASRKLGPYFQAHKIEEVDQGALVTIPGAEMNEQREQNIAPLWSLFVDGASNGEGAGAGIEPISPEGHKIRHATHLAFHATNNDAEYEALINGIKLALKMRVENLNIGELPKAKGGVKYVVVAVDYFTKWDNGKQFDNKEMRKFCEQLGIQKSFNVVSHPQINRQTEAVNKIIKQTLKAKLEENKGTWPEELSQVLVSYNTTPRTTTGESPFSMVYGCEAMVPVDVGARSF